MVEIEYLFFLSFAALKELVFFHLKYDYYHVFK